MACSGVGLVAGAGFFGLIGFAPFFLDRILLHRGEVRRAQRVVRKYALTGVRGTVAKSKNVSIRIIRSEEAPGWGLRFAHETRIRDFHGREALHIAHLVSPLVNIEGGDKDFVRMAVREIELAGSPEKYFSRILSFTEKKQWQYGGIAEYPNEMRLAFEMASHEETERVAMEGELAQLENDWREAEEIAAIADNLFLPQAVTDFIARHRGAKTISTPE